jgi:hypothetical protein
MPAPMISYSLPRLDPAAQLKRARVFYEEMERRRSVRFFFR